MKACGSRLVCGLFALCLGWGIATSALAGGLDGARALLLAAAPVDGPALGPDVLTGKPVIVTFFASWCPPCTDEFITLNQVRDRYPSERLSIVAINAFEAWGGKKNPARMARFLDRTKPAFPMVEATGEILRVFGNVERIPTLIVYDRDGREVWRFVHAVDAAKTSASLQDIQQVLARLNAE